MATYIIGDIHGCFEGLQQLLNHIGYNSGTDNLCFTGDLVNRGPDSPAVLNFIYTNDNASLVLGNHDLHLLALESNPSSSYYNGLKTVCQHENYKLWCDWLRQQPLIYTLDNFCLVHAGIYPKWSIAEAISYASEVATILSGSSHQALLENMYGNLPATWSEDLSGWDRIRFIINAFVRMRYLTLDGACDFEHTMHPKDKPQGLIPWYEYPNPQYDGETTIAFGHWASIKAQPIRPSILALDGGYVWGGELVAWHLETNTRFSISNNKPS